MPNVLSKGSVNFVTIVSVHRLANLRWGDVSWPIIWDRPLLDAASLWDLVRVGKPGNNQWTIRENRGERYLIPGEPGLQSSLSTDTAVWTIEPAGAPDVNLFRISIDGQRLQAGYRYENPSDAYAAVVGPTQVPEDSTADLWIIEFPRA